MNGEVISNIYEKNEIEVKDRRPREEVVVCICVNVQFFRREQFSVWYG